MPRRRGRRVRAADIEGHEELIAQQQQIMRAQYPRLADENIPTGITPMRTVAVGPRIAVMVGEGTEGSSRNNRRPTSSTAAQQVTSRRRPGTSGHRPVRHPPSPSVAQPMVQSLTQPEAAPALPTAPQTVQHGSQSEVQSTIQTVTQPDLARTESTPATASPTPPRIGPTETVERRSRANQLMQRFSTSSFPNPNIHPETGKWRPVHNWSAMYDMIYAKKCMAVLLSKSPRKTNLIITQGKRWIIDWATGALERCEPPAYGELEDVVTPWGLAPSGMMVRI